MAQFSVGLWLSSAHHHQIAGSIMKNTKLQDIDSRTVENDLKQNVYSMFRTDAAKKAIDLSEKVPPNESNNYIKSKCNIMRHFNDTDYMIFEFIKVSIRKVVLGNLHSIL